MSCKDKHHDHNCVANALEHILDEQEAVEEVNCPSSCFSNLLNPAVSPTRDTVPFILFTKEGDLFKAFGNVGELSNGDCFKTIFFRIENIEDSCATLSLLRPYNSHGHTECVTDPCDVFGLAKSDFCIEVDLDCFCAIQCLSPDLVGRATS